MLLSNKTEGALTHTTTGVNFKNVLSERNQTQKSTVYFPSCEVSQQAKTNQKKTVVVKRGWEGPARSWGDGNVLSFDGVLFVWTQVHSII